MSETIDVNKENDGEGPVPTAGEAPSGRDRAIDTRHGDFSLVPTRRSAQEDALEVAPRNWRSVSWISAGKPRSLSWR